MKKRKKKSKQERKEETEKTIKMYNLRKRKEEAFVSVSSTEEINDWHPCG